MSDKPYRVAALSVAAVIAMAAGAVIAAESVSLTDRPEFVTEYSLPIPPGHEPYVMAAGYRVCADLAEGAPLAGLRERYVRDGIGGDLFSAESVGAILRAVPILCSGVDIPPDGGHTR